MYVKRQPNNLYGAVGSRTISPRLVKPSFNDGSILEERDQSGRIISRFRCGKILGKGGFAKCYEVVDVDTGAVYAIKAIERATLAKAKMQSKLQSEIAIHRRMNHPNIVRFYKTFQDDWYVYIVLEKCSNQTLMEISRTRTRFSMAEAQHILVQSIAAINYMHQNGVIHRDLKLGNMMMDSEMNVKIGDFGLAAELQYDGERKRTICGTPNYIAPEILEGGCEGHSFEVDVWSLGVILFTLLVGEPPFQTNDVKTTYNRIKQCRYAFPSGVIINEQGRNLVHNILQSKPEKRPLLMEVRKHPFFLGAPTCAPLSLFPESQRRQMEIHRNSAPTITNQYTSVKKVIREPLKQLNGNNQQTPMMTPYDNCLNKIDCGRSATTSNAAENNVKTGRERANTVRALPTSGLYKNSLQPTPANVINEGWTNKYDSRPPSPREVAAAPAPTVKPAEAKNFNEDDNDDRHLTKIHNHLHQTFHGIADEEDEAVVCYTPTVWVTDYADFSAKYGLAYRLNTGHTAVHYNDSTKMIWEPITNKVEYYARIKETVNGVVHAQDQKQTFNMDFFPEALTKKVTLIKYFKNYLTKAKGKKDSVEIVTCSPYISTTTPLLSDPNMTNDMCYVKRWQLTNEAIFFRLSNKSIQVCFFDKTEVILSSETKIVTYTDCNGNRVTIPLSCAVNQNEEVANRLKLTKDILSKLINNKEI